MQSAASWQTTVTPQVSTLCENGMNAPPLMIYDIIIMLLHHLTGQFIGLACSICNLKRSEIVRFNVFAHNFR